MAIMNQFNKFIINFLLILTRILISINSEITSTASSQPQDPLPYTSTAESLLTNQKLQISKHIFSFVKNFQIVCCMGGIPQLSHPELVRNFSIDKSSSYVIAGHKEYGHTVNLDSNENCRLFKGSFMLPQSIFGVPVELSYATHVVCRCPELTLGHTIDRSCRRLPNCQNNGFRSLLDPRRCFCLDPFFGERCEKFCDRGRRLRGSDSKDYCSCIPFYRGEECREPICLNGGRQQLDGCDCKPHFFGFHCEFDGNLTHRLEFQSDIGGTVRAGGIPSRFHQRYGSSEHGSESFSTRDLSGTVFSLVMIIVLVLSMYLLMKHRMQAQTRCLNRRTTDLLGACNFPHGLESSMSRGSEVSSQLQPPPRNGQSHERRVELFPNAEQVASTAGFGIYSLPPFMRSLTPFFAVGDGGPPPYTSQTQRVRRSRNDVLPPLPSYEAATKLPVIGESQSESGQELQHQERQGHELFNPQLPNEAQIEHEEGIIEAPIEERIRTGHGELLELQERNKDKLPSAESNHCQAETQNR